MAQIDFGQPLSLSLSAKDWAERKGQNLSGSAQSPALVSALRSLSSVALSSARAFGVYHRYYPPFAKGTSLLCRKGDISTLH